MGGALHIPDILLNLPRPIHWSSLDHPRTESANAVSFADWGEQGWFASDARWRRNAPARNELRNGSNKSEREPTSDRSTNYGSGHLIRVFRDIGRIFSLLFLLSHPSPIGDPAEREGSKAETEYGFVEGKKWFQLCFVRNSPRWTSRQRVIRHYSSSCWQCLGTHEAIMRCRCGALEGPRLKNPITGIVGCCARAPAASRRAAPERDEFAAPCMSGKRRLVCRERSIVRGDRC